MLSEAARWRVKALSMAVVAFAFTAIDGWGGAQDLRYLFSGFSEQRPIITSSHYAGTMLLLAPMGFTFGVICLFAKKATPEQMKQAAGHQTFWGLAFLFFIPGSIVAAFAAPVVQYIVVDHLATSRGYASCPTPDWPRHQPDRWARAITQCPKTGADPNV